MKVKEISWFNLRNRNPELPAGAKGMIDGQTVCRIIMGPGDAYRIHIEGNRYLLDEKLIGIYFTELPNAILFFENDFVPHTFDLYFETEPDCKRIIKRIYRLYLSKILENKIWRIWFAGGETPDQTKEVAIDADRFFQDEKNEFKKRVLGVEVKNV